MIVFAPWRVSSFPLETFGGRMQYAPTRVHFNSQNISVSGYVGAQKHTPSQIRTRPNFLALGRGLDLLLLLFFYQEKKRRLERQKILHQKNKISYTLKISTYNSSVKIFLRFFREKFVAIQNSYTLAAAQDSGHKSNYILKHFRVVGNTPDRF